MDEEVKKVDSYEKSSVNPRYYQTGIAALLLTGFVFLPITAKRLYDSSFFVFEVTLESSKTGWVQIAYDIDQGRFHASDPESVYLREVNTPVTCRFKLPQGDCRYLRFDPIDQPSAIVNFHGAKILDPEGKVVRNFLPSEFKPAKDIHSLEIDGGFCRIVTVNDSGDPILEIPLEELLILRHDRPWIFWVNTFLSLLAVFLFSLGFAFLASVLYARRQRREDSLWKITSFSLNLFLFFLAIAYGIFIRYSFLVEFPYAFGHPDSAQYLNAVVDMLNEHPFVPPVIRPAGTYVFFVYGTLKFLSSESFSVILVQSFLGLLTGLIGFMIIKELTKSFFLANLGLLLLLSLPRGIFYEHVMLVESLYVFLIMVFCGVALMLYRRPSWYLSLLLGLVSSFLLHARGHGIAAIVTGLGLLGWGLVRKRIKPFEFVKLLIIFITPIAILSHLYIQANRQYNNFNGITAMANFNLFTATTSRLMDYDSPIHQDMKSIFKPYVQATNENYDGDESWSAEIEPVFLFSTLLPAILRENNGWQKVNKIFGELAREAIITHPLAYLYRIYWVSYDFFYNKTSLLKTIDISQAYLKGDKNSYTIDPVKLFESRKMNPIEKVAVPPKGLDLLARHLTEPNPSIVVPTRTDKHIRRFSFLANFRLFTWVLYVFLGIVLFNRLKYRFFALLIFSLAMGQIIVTVIFSNAMYDRYFILIEPLVVILFCFTLFALSELTWKERFRTIVLLCSFPVFLYISFKLLLLLLPIHYPIIDKPILGMSEQIIIRNQSFTVMVTFATLLAIVGVWLMSRLLSRMGGRS